MNISTATFYKLALEIWRHERVADDADEGTESGECAAAPHPWVTALADDHAVWAHSPGLSTNHFCASKNTHENMD
jgi:hypothetical protein